jgi:UDP-hydrolysing UDP-N-acetyl-D-glucosamine 2-epimerase
MSQTYGKTLSELDLPASAVDEIDVDLDSDNASALLGATARISTGMGAVLARRRPDILVVLGDRYELLAVATAALLFRVPLAHLHGGEITQGSFDDQVRHSITKLSHLHFCSCEEYAARVLSMGEESWRVHVTGAPALDRLEPELHLGSTLELERRLAATLIHPLGLVTYHPPTGKPDRINQELEAILAACDQLAMTVITYPGADPGSSEIIRRLNRWAAGRANAVVVPSLGPLYPTAMANADVMIGNSSSGIYEAASFALPVVNVGDRQKGRIRAAGVIDVPGELDAVREAVRTALDPDFRAELVGTGNPFGDGHASERISGVLATVPLDDLLDKRFVDRT